MATQDPQEVISAGVGTIATITVAGIALNQLKKIGAPQTKRKGKMY